MFTRRAPDVDRATGGILTRAEWFVVGKYAFLAFALFAAPVWYVVESWWRRRRRRALEVVQARVVHGEIEERAPRFGYRPRWDVEYEHRGQRHRAACREADAGWYTGSSESYVTVVRDAVERRLGKYPVGGTIPVRLLPGRPHEVALAHESIETGPLYLVLGMVGVVALAMVVLYLLP